MSERELRAIARIANSLPENSCIVETGSLFGLSSYVWAKSAPKSTVYCIDPWVRERWIEELELTIPGCPEFSKSAFDKFTADCSNITALIGYSPINFTNWNTPIDVFFDDAVHKNPEFRNNLEFWLKHIKPNGIICGHDFSRQFPDVKREVKRVARQLGATINLVETFWWIELNSRRRGPLARAQLFLSPFVLSMVALWKSLISSQTCFAHSG
jgi:hypothetical protein